MALIFILTLWVLSFYDEVNGQLGKGVKKPENIISENTFVCFFSIAFKIDVIGPKNDFAKFKWFLVLCDSTIYSIIVLYQSAELAVESVLWMIFFNYKLFF